MKKIIQLVPKNDVPEDIEHLMSTYIHGYNLYGALNNALYGMSVTEEPEATVEDARNLLTTLGFSWVLDYYDLSVEHVDL